MIKTVCQLPGLGLVAKLSALRPCNIRIWDMRQCVDLRKMRLASQCNNNEKKCTNMPIDTL